MKVQGVFLVAIFSLTYTQLVKCQSFPRCPKRCGDVAIEYPFGTAPGCYYAEDDSFYLTCNETGKKLFFGTNIPVINISLSGELRIQMPISSCENSTSGVFYNISLANLSLSKKNMFTAVGCNIYAVMTTTVKDRNFSTGCLSLCGSPPVANGLISGEGYCTNSVPGESNYFIFGSGRFNESPTSINDFNPCFYAFLVEGGVFKFSATEDLRSLWKATESPVVLDWSIGNQTCNQVGKTSICGGNSKC